MKAKFRRLAQKLAREAVRDALDLPSEGIRDILEDLAHESKGRISKAAAEMMDAFDEDDDEFWDFRMAVDELIAAASKVAICSMRAVRSK